MTTTPTGEGSALGTMMHSGWTLDALVRRGLDEAFRSYLGDGVYVCSRDASAWRHGTMTLEDFGVLASEDEETISSLVAIALDARAALASQSVISTHAGWKHEECSRVAEALLGAIQAVYLDDLPPAHADEKQVRAILTAALCAASQTSTSGLIRALSGPFDGSEGLDSATLAWAIAKVEEAQATTHREALALAWEEGAEAQAVFQCNPNPEGMPENPYR